MDNFRDQTSQVYDTLDTATYGKKQPAFCQLRTQKQLFNLHSYHCANRMVWTRIIL